MVRTQGGKVTQPAADGTRRAASRNADDAIDCTQNPNQPHVLEWMASKWRTLALLLRRRERKSGQSERDNGELHD